MSALAQTAFDAVLFDFDGTLADTNQLIIVSFQHTLKEKLGLSVSADELYAYFGEPLPDTMARYAPDRAEELADFYRLFNVANHDALIREFRGVRATIAGLLAAGVRLAVVTSKKVATARLGLKATQLEPYFEVVVGLDETAKHKPDPEPALLALQRLGLRPSDRILMVGDSRFDILCGKSAGLKTAGVGWTVQRESVTKAEPDYWIEEPEELIGLVLGGARASSAAT